MTTYAVTLWLTVKGPGFDTNFDDVVAQYAAIEQASDALLDCAWSLDDKDAHGDVEVEATVTGESASVALQSVVGAVITAVERAGAHAVAWDVAVPGVVYRLANEDVTTIDAA